MRNVIAGKTSNTPSTTMRAAGPQTHQLPTYAQSEAPRHTSTSWRNSNPRARQPSRLGQDFHPPSPILENDSPHGSSGAGHGGGWTVATPKTKSRGGSHISQMAKGSTNRAYHRAPPSSDASKPYDAFPVNRTKSNMNGGGSRAPSAVSHLRNGGGHRAPSATSQLKQSALPVSERDPELYEIELNEGTRVNKDSFRPGLIFRTVHHEPQADLNATKGTKGRTESKYGPISTKYRKMIVIGIYEDHCVCVPMYTHNGDGLEHKLKPDEFVSIRDPRTGVSTEDFHKESKHKPIIAGKMYPDTELYSSRAVVHFTYPVSFRYIWKMIPEGVLEGISLVELKALHDRYPSGTVRK